MVQTQEASHPKTALAGDHTKAQEAITPISQTSVHEQLRGGHENQVQG